MLSLALDPFFQQSVGYSSMAIEDSTGVAESVTAHTYDSGADLLGTYNSSCKLTIIIFSYSFHHIG